MKCFKCGYPVLPKYKVCPHCGTALTENQPVAASGDDNEYSVVNNRAIWNIQKGEVAHVISEREFAHTGGLRGVVLPEGCSAIVFSGKEVVSLMQAGVYDFQPANITRLTNKPQPAPHAAPAAPQTTSGGFWMGVKNFLFGKKKDEKPEAHQRRMERVGQRFAQDSPMAPTQNVRVYLVSTRNIDLLFDATIDDEGNLDFMPISIPTATIDVNLSVALQLQVQNMAMVAANYLADSNTLRTLDLMQMLRPIVKATLTKFLRNLDYQREGLPEAVVNNLKAKIIQACNEQLAGIEVVKVLSITDSSDDFERFRKIEKDLYVDNKKLDYLQRTNEFKNRLEQLTNQQTIEKAQSAEELRKSLQQINKDKLLNEDEMNQFTQMLESQQRLRKAKTQAEELQALSDLKKSTLVTEDEVKALEQSLAEKGISRDSVVDIMRVQAEQKLNTTRQIATFELSDNEHDHERAEELKAAQHNGKLLAANLEAKRQMDAYQDERKKQEFEQRVQNEDYDFNKQQRQNDADFKQRVQSEDYDFNKQQRQNDADFKQRVQSEDYDFNKQQRQNDADFKQRVQSEDYDFNKQQRQNDADFKQRVQNEDYDFNKQQRQNDADFKQRVQNDDYDFEKKQREDLHQFEQDQRAFKMRVQNEDYDFNKQQRQNDADFKQRVQNEDYDFEKKQREDLHQFEQDQRTFQTRVKNEDYDFEKQQREQALREQQSQADYMRKRQDKMDDMDILERKAAIAQRNMQAMKQAEMAELQEKNRSVEAMQQMQQNVEMNRDNLFANMSAEQIRAAQLSHLSAEAQTAMAQSYSSNKENELRAQQQQEQKVLYEQMMQQQAAQATQNQEMMMRMAQMMQQGMTSMGQQQMAQQQQRYEEQKAIKEEYRENAFRQQDRVDHSQDTAMQHIAQVSTAAAANMNAYGNKNAPEQPQPHQIVSKKCPSCGAEIAPDDVFCTECGARV
jgi:hypothetical protein